MRLTDEQRELLQDKFVLWDAGSRTGNMELRDYNRRAAGALKMALSICSESPDADTSEASQGPGIAHETGDPHG